MGDSKHSTTSYLTSDNKYLIVNDKKYIVLSIQRCMLYPRCVSDKTDPDIAHIAYPFRDAMCTICRVCHEVTTLKDKLKRVHSLEELNGFANRRKVLGVDLPKWTDEERQLILKRKYELQRQHGTRRK